MLLSDGSSHELFDAASLTDLIGDVSADVGPSQQRRRSVRVARRMSLLSGLEDVYDSLPGFSDDIEIPVKSEVQRGSIASGGNDVNASTSSGIANLFGAPKPAQRRASRTQLSRLSMAQSGRRNSLLVTGGTFEYPGDEVGDFPGGNFSFDEGAHVGSGSAEQSNADRVTSVTGRQNKVRGRRRGRGRGRGCEREHNAAETAENSTLVAGGAPTAARASSAQRKRQKSVPMRGSPQKRHRPDISISAPRRESMRRLSMMLDEADLSQLLAEVIEEDAAGESATTASASASTSACNRRSSTRECGAAVLRSSPVALAPAGSRRHSMVRRVSLWQNPRRLSVRQSLSMRNSRRYSAAMSLTDDEFLQLLEGAADNMAEGTSDGVGDAAVSALGSLVGTGPILHTLSCASLVMTCGTEGAVALRGRIWAFLSLPHKWVLAQVCVAAYRDMMQYTIDGVAGQVLPLSSSRQKLQRRRRSTRLPATVSVPARLIADVRWPLLQIHTWVAMPFLRLMRGKQQESETLRRLLRETFRGDTAAGSFIVGPSGFCPARSGASLPPISKFKRLCCELIDPTTRVGVYAGFHYRACVGRVVILRGSVECSSVEDQMKSSKSTKTSPTRKLELVERASYSHHFKWAGQEPFTPNLTAVADPSLGLIVAGTAQSPTDAAMEMQGGAWEPLSSAAILQDCSGADWTLDTVDTYGRVPGSSLSKRQQIDVDNALVQIRPEWREALKLVRTEAAERQQNVESRAKRLVPDSTAPVVVKKQLGKKNSK